MLLRKKQEFPRKAAHTMEAGRNLWKPETEPRMEVCLLLSSLLMLLFSGALFSLRLGPGGSFPRPLKPEEEQRALEEWVNEGKLEARNLLVEHNLRLVAHIVKKYYAQSAEQDDLISIGTVGLIKGVSTYRPDKKVRLATYCSRCIENEILMFFRSQRKSAGDVSLSDSIDSDADGEGLSLMDTLAEERDMAEDVSRNEMCRATRECVETVLTPREAEIIRQRYGLDGAEKPRTQREVADAFGISRSYVSRIEKKALEKLRKALDVS